jgi:hypothetical protein
MKAKIDNVKAKVQDEEDEDPNQDTHWQDVKSPTSWWHLRPVPYKRDPPDKSPPRTSSPRLRMVRGPRHAVRAWGMSTTTEMRGGAIPHAMQMHQLAVMQAAGPDKSLNAGLSSCTAIPSTSSPTLPQASSTRGTQAPPTMSSSLDLGLSMAG